MPSTISALPSTPAHTEQQLREELAAMYRLIAHFGMTDLIFTHISARLPGPDHHFLINPYGLLFEEITASSLVRIDLQGTKIGGSTARVNPAGFVIHSAIHAAREDASCIVHTHTKAGCAVAASPHGLLPVNQISMEFYGRVGYHEYEGVALNLDEQARLVRDIGPHHALILRNHGLLTVGETPGQAFLRMFYLNKACEIQLEALSAGVVTLPDDDVCEHAAQQLNGDGSDDLVDDDDFVDEDANVLTWQALLRLADRVAPGYKD